MGVPVVSHFGLVSRAAICATSMVHPARRAISSALRLSTLKVPPPTVPNPQMPTFTDFTLDSPCVRRGAPAGARKRAAHYEGPGGKSIGRAPGASVGQPVTTVPVEIGRASCRERVEIRGVGGIGEGKGKT